MNLVDRYPHKRLTAEYFKKKIDWLTLISFSSRSERSPIVAMRSMEYPDTVVNIPGRQTTYCTLEFDITHANPEMVDGLMSQKESLEFTYGSLEHVLKDPVVISSQVDFDNWGRAILTLEILVREMETRII